MRITNNTLTGNYLRNLNRNLKQMQKYQNQLSTGKEISKPSDNPILVARVMGLDNNIRTNEQYGRNIDDSLGWTDTADGAMNEITSVVQRARELVVYGANGSLSDTDRLALRDEVEMLKGQMVQMLNTNYDGRFIFGGQKTTEPPFSIGADDKMTYAGGKNADGEGLISREIAQGVSIHIESDGSQITTADDAITKDFGALLDNVILAMENGDTDSLSGELLGDMDAHLDNVIRFRSKMGAVYNRLEAAKERNASESLSMTELLSKSEDIDLAEKMMEFSMMSTVYQASLSTGAKILQPSLLDYIR
ncbi:flagellar hook-associated protein FlgL [Proteiniclasticum sp. C24MP]|uniref:flagellar hook-associated protein FlgL n=1 Tax=Proteiniclasticum sp. C24MP TaxID=3374101 RepID=UPI0037552D2E